MEKYQKGKIYKLTCSENDLVYYGSTIHKLKLRLQKHKTGYTGYLKGKERYVTSFEIIKYSSAKIELVEEISCDTKKELHEKEGFYIRNNECVNKIIPVKWTEEENREYMKQYNEKHKEKLKEQSKLYREKNKEKIREERKEKIQCDCGREITKHHILRHKKTNFHITTLFNINNNN